MGRPVRRTLCALRLSPGWKWLFRAAVAAALLVWLFGRANPGALWHLVARQSATDFAALIALVALGMVVGTFKWRLLLPVEKFSLLLQLNLAAGFYSLIIPGQLGAEVIKAYQLGRGRVDAETIAASVVLDKVIGLLSLLALGVAGTLMTSLPLGQELRLALAGLFAGGVAALFGLRIPALRQFTVDCGTRLLALFPALDRPIGRYKLFIDAWCQYLQRPAVLWVSLAVGVAQQAVYVVMISVLSRQLGFDLPISEWCWIFALASVAAILPISLAGLGVREGVFVGLLGAFAVPLEQALALSLTIFSLQVVFGLVGGGLELSRIARRT